VRVSVLLCYVLLIGTSELPTLDTVDSYMTRLHAAIAESPRDNAALATTVRTVISRMSFDC